MRDLPKRTVHWAARTAGIDPEYFPRLSLQTAPDYRRIKRSDERALADDAVRLDPCLVFLDCSVANAAPPPDARLLPPPHGALPDVAALVLAGGEGRRMGGGKPHRALGPRRLLDHAIAAAGRHGGPVAVSVREAKQAPASIDLVIDSRYVEGPLAGLLAGLAWAEDLAAPFLLTLPCDAPFLPRNLAQRLLGRLRQTGAVAALPMSAGRLHPSCGLWRVDALRQAAVFTATGRSSLLGFAAFLGFTVEDWGVPARDPFFNVNTPADLAVAEAWLAEAD